jgi:Peptidase C13 family
MNEHESAAQPPNAAAGGADVRRTWPKAMLRLMLLRPLRALPEGTPTVAILGMGALWAMLWTAIDWWQSQPQPAISAAEVPLMAWYVVAVLALAWLLRAASQTRSHATEFAAMTALALGAVPVPLLLTGIGALYLSPRVLTAAGVAAGIYLVFYLGRALRAVTGQRQQAAALLGVMFIIGFVWLSDALNVVPDLWNPQQLAEEHDASADAESILFEQPARIDDALSGIADKAPLKPSAFFIGFAGVGDEKVFAEEIGLASRVLTERYEVGERSLSLINDERDLDGAPLATVSGLRYALHAMAEKMDVNRDVLFLAISSHGSPEGDIAVANSRLPLSDLTGNDIADALQDAGIKWRVIVISACYAGALIEPLADPKTIVITAAAADRTSFGCSNDRDLTYFGEAFYRDALPEAHSLREAFDKAKAAIAIREQREKVDASNPQAFFGEQMEAKLAAMSADHGTATRRN